MRHTALHDSQVGRLFLEGEVAFFPQRHVVNHFGEASIKQMIRPVADKDIPKLKELADWKFGPDFLTGLVVTDSTDSPVLFAGAWQIAEVHIAMDRQWSTPGVRDAALKELHAAMEKELHRLHVGQAVTWFDKACSFTRRLKGLGWVMSEKVSFHRGIH